MIIIITILNMPFPESTTNIQMQVQCGSAFEPGASGLPYSCTPPVCVSDLIGALTVWRQNIGGKKNRLSQVCPLCISHHVEHLLLFSMLILHVTSSRFCLYLLNIYHFTYTFSHAHTEAHTHKRTCTISTQEE